jgi:hypothetical protein
MGLFGTTAGYFEYPIPAGQARTISFPFMWEGTPPTITAVDVVLPDDVSSMQPEVEFFIDDDDALIVQADFSAEKSALYNGARRVDVYLTLQGTTRLALSGYVNFYTSVHPPTTVGAETFPITLGDAIVQTRAALGGPRGAAGADSEGGGEALQEHIEAPKPHPVYDDSMMDLGLWAINQLV